jgi:hypothetical protein
MQRTVVPCARQQLPYRSATAGVVVMGCRFVDRSTTMLDESIPLTIGEYEEWATRTTREVLRVHEVSVNISAQVRAICIHLLLLNTLIPALVPFPCLGGRLDHYCYQGQARYLVEKRAAKAENMVHFDTSPSAAGIPQHPRDCWPARPPALLTGSSLLSRLLRPRQTPTHARNQVRDGKVVTSANQDASTGFQN